MLMKCGSRFQDEAVASDISVVQDASKHRKRLRHTQSWIRCLRDVVRLLRLHLEKKRQGQQFLVGAQASCTLRWHEHSVPAADACREMKSLMVSAGTANAKHKG